MTDNLTGVVLIGGRSRRFGSDKSQAVIGAHTLGERTASTLSHVTPNVVVSGRPEQSPSLPSFRFIPDRTPDQGPLAALSSVFASTETDWLVVCACDMPGVTVETLLTLLRLRTNGTDAVVPRDRNGRLHPLVACYRRSTAPTCAHLLETGERRMHAFVSEIGKSGLLLSPTFSQDVLRNVNRFKDLDAFSNTSTQ